MKVFRFILLITAIAIVACGKGDEDVNKVIAVNSVAISPNGPITLFPGEEVTLTASIEPENSTTRKAEWSSDNSSIATVTATGKVKAIAVGTAIITAKAEDKVATCRIDVTEEIIEAEDIVISPTGAQTLQPGEELQLTAIISPENATNKSVIWSSDDRDIAMVDATGLVKAIDEGVAIITASIGKLTATCNLTVAREIIEVTSVEITPEGPITITEGEELQLTTTIAPENATNKEVTWSSSDKTIATVSETGLVTAIAAGEATITASAGDITAECVVIVERAEVAVSEVQITPAGPLTIEPNEEIQLTATVLPENATERSVVWACDDAEVLSISENGLVKALTEGTAMVTATAGGIVAECEITVMEGVVAVTAVTIDNEELLTLTEGEELQLTATVAPENATNKEVTWSSSDNTIATVSETGLVMAIAAGEATITASAGEVSDSVEITVEPLVVEVESVTITPAEAQQLTEGEELQLTATVAPENATNKEVTWSSSDNTIATVSETGLVTAIAAGEATITASAGEASDEIVITVEQPSTPVVTVPDGWIVNGNTATYKVSTTMDFDLVVTFENEVCKTVRFTTLTRESRATDIEAVFPESVLDAFAITGRGTVATIDLLLVAGCKEYFENLTMAEMFAVFGDNTSAILANWTTSFSVTNLVTGNWEMPDINTLRERVNGGKDDGFSIMRVLVTYNEITGTADSTTWTIGFETEEIAAKFLQLVERQNEVLFNRFADYIRKVQPREPILQIDVTDIFPESDQSAMEDVLSTTDVCRDLLSLAIGL